MLELLRDPHEGRKSLKRFNKDISLHEVFLESVPSFFIMTVLMVHNTTDNTLAGDFHDLSIAGHFLFTYFTSIFSSSIGIAKCLMFGAARIMTPDGPFNGQLSGRFIFAFLASNTSLLSKGYIVLLLSDLKLEEQIIMIFLPNLLLALMLILKTKKSSLKMILSHPSLLLMPVFTLFTFSKINSGCGNGEKDERIAFSLKFTIINFFLSVGYVDFDVLH